MEALGGAVPAVGLSWSKPSVRAATDRGSTAPGPWPGPPSEGPGTFRCNPSLAGGPFFRAHPGPLADPSTRKASLCEGLPFGIHSIPVLLGRTAGGVLSRSSIPGRTDFISHPTGSPGIHILSNSAAQGTPGGGVLSRGCIRYLSHPTGNQVSHIHSTTFLRGTPVGGASIRSSNPQTGASNGCTSTDEVHPILPSAGSQGTYIFRGVAGDSAFFHDFIPQQSSRRRPMQLQSRAAVSHPSDVEISSNSTPTADVLNLWRTADAVCFDVDSTVCLDEGIDELATFCGAGEAVAAWTTRAMTGNVPFQDALAARLDIMKPSAADVSAFLASNPPKLSPGIRELVGTIKARGAEVYLVSGGFRQMIEPVAALLGIPEDHIFANRLLFDSSTGQYAGFDEAEPTSRAGGKATAIERIKSERGFQKLIMLGDGATDLEARRPGGADAFIGYGGVQVRPTVAAGADWFVSNFQVLIEALHDS